MTATRTRIGDLFDGLMAATLAVASIAVIGGIVAQVAGLG